MADHGVDRFGCGAAPELRHSEGWLRISWLDQDRDLAGRCTFPYRVCFYFKLV